MDADPIKGLHYVCVHGPPGEVRVFRREVAKLPEWSLPEGDGAIYVAKRDAGAGDTAREADARAKRLLLDVNRALMLEGREPLTKLQCGGSFRTDEVGKRHFAIVGEAGRYGMKASPARLEGVGTVSGPGATAPPRDPFAIRIAALEALRGIEAVETMLNLFASEGDRLDTLCKIIERVRAALGSEIPREWISKAKLELLMRTANDHRAGGLTARHHAAKTEPPAVPMPLEEARDYVRRILDNLIRRMAGRANL